MLAAGRAGAPPLALLSLRSLDEGGVGRWLHPLEDSAQFHRWAEEINTGPLNPEVGMAA